MCGVCVFDVVDSDELSHTRGKGISSQSKPMEIKGKERVNQAICALMGGLRA